MPGDPPQDQVANCFGHPIVVLPSDIDVNGHANNVVYVRWIQEAAVAHWFAVVDPDRARAVSWVVIRHEVDYMRPALAGDSLVARTWVGAPGPAHTFSLMGKTLRKQTKSSERP